MNLNKRITETIVIENPSPRLLAIIRLSNIKRATFWKNYHEKININLKNNQDEK